jgi:uncharacterized protein
MNDSSEIDTLLLAPASEAVAEQLINWANAARNEVLRGDMMLGILTADDVAKIPLAYEKAAQYGKPEAWLRLAWWYAQPEFGEQDLDKALASVQKAIDAGVAEAPLELVKIVWFFKGDDATESEKKQVYQILSSIFEAGDPGAEVTYLLALITCVGFGTTASPERAFELLQKAASLGLATAMFELSLYYAKGIGVAPNQEASFKACRAAAEAGHPRAMYNLGAFYATGHHVPKDAVESRKWYELAAEAGNASALVGLAAIYATGDGADADPDYARELLEQADYCGINTNEIRRQLAL